MMTESATIEATLRQHLAREILFTGQTYPHSDTASFLENGIVDSMGTDPILASGTPAITRYAGFDEYRKQLACDDSGRHRELEGQRNREAGSIRSESERPRLPGQRSQPSASRAARSANGRAG